MNLCSQDECVLRGFLNLRPGEVKVSRTETLSFTSLDRPLSAKEGFAPEGLTKWESEGREEASSPKTLHSESLLAHRQQQYRTLIRSQAPSPLTSTDTSTSCRSLCSRTAAGSLPEPAFDRVPDPMASRGPDSQPRPPRGATNPARAARAPAPSRRRRPAGHGHLTLQSLRTNIMPWPG